jgi:hypothetical protein
MALALGSADEQVAVNKHRAEQFDDHAPAASFALGVDKEPIFSQINPVFRSSTPFWGVSGLEPNGCNTQFWKTAE